MRLMLLEVETGERVPATISRTHTWPSSLKKAGWQFSWKDLVRVEGAHFFKITLDSRPDRIEGILMLSVYFDEMVYMNNLELAPGNVGKEKKYDYVAGALIAFGCRFSLEHGRGDYQGYLTFESKSKLIPLYQEKYGARRTGGLKMYIDPIQGERLIETYLRSEKTEP